MARRIVWPLSCVKMLISVWKRRSISWTVPRTSTLSAVWLTKAPGAAPLIQAVTASMSFGADATSEAISSRDMNSCHLG